MTLVAAVFGVRARPVWGDGCVAKAMLVGMMVSGWRS
ncbi:hypothetical protein Trad_2633 [Truepera radiovictrix DSM 17093]|uniref:Uncharacterized protein n=1 Tax=Truepera radiovictrix (strain DSM 17093 / CIP 108686 / LMG 22925 / RQ-24) TaxID=649638 RepID=D7CUF4_TRURR|nr:hypothetical protein Trad_2633 [Truepera radiovictrix DSM 17093]